MVGLTPVCVGWHKDHLPVGLICQRLPHPDCMGWHKDHRDCRSVWISPDLRILDVEPWQRPSLGYDVTTVDNDGERRAYRRLNVPWLVWLMDHRARIKNHLDAGTIDRDRAAAFLARWPTVLQAAKRYFGLEAVRQARERKPHYGYTHPQPRPPQGQPASAPAAMSA